MRSCGAREDEFQGWFSSKGFVFDESKGMQPEKPRHQRRIGHPSNNIKTFHNKKFHDGKTFECIKINEAHRKRLHPVEKTIYSITMKHSSLFVTFHRQHRSSISLVAMPSQCLAEYFSPCCCIYIISHIKQFDT